MQIKTKTETEASFSDREQALNFIRDALANPSNTKVSFSDRYWNVNNQYVQTASERYHIEVTNEPDREGKS